MKNALLFLLVSLLPLEVFGRQEAGSGQTALVFTHVTVIDATGAPAKPDMTVVIKGGRIAALGKTGNLDVPENAQVVDATGKFLIPGLWDMHIHPLNKKDYLALFTANGVTGVRVMWGEPVHHKWREEISAGKLIGPRMVIASPIVDGPKPVHDGSTVVSNEDEGRQVVRKVKKEDADFVKVYDKIPRDAYFAIADEAKKRGIPFAGHVPYSVSSAEASDAGQQSIEHCLFVLLACSSEGEEELRKKHRDARVGDVDEMRAFVKLFLDTTYSEKKAAALFARFVKNSTWVCPTLIFRHGLLFRDEEDLANVPRLKYIPLSTRYWWKNDVRVAVATGEGRDDFRKTCEKNLAIVGAMRNAGVGLLAGTDACYVNNFPGFGLHDELALFVQAGLSPMEALQTATYNPAKFFGKLDSMGTVEEGKIADLVLLDANPLQDISNTQKIAAVVVGGKIFQKAALQKMLAQVEAAAKKSKIIFISLAAMPLVVGLALAIPLVLSLRRVAGQPKRFFRYFALLIGMCLVEYLAVVALLVLSSGLVSELVFVCGPACAWGIVFGLWLRGRSAAGKVLKASVFVSLYTCLPIVCFDIFFGLPLALMLGTILLKTVLITGEVGLLIRLGGKSSEKDQTKY